MSDGWFPLPFPECPYCGNAWVSTKHRDCERNGGMEVEPWHERVRCDSCSQHWNLIDSRFFCSCGRQFDAVDVEEAVGEVVRATRSLYRELAEQHAELVALRSRSETSFSIFLGQMANMVGGAAGFIVGKLIRILFD